MLEKLINTVIGLCIEVHKELGPGFLENIYHRALEIRFNEEGLSYKSEIEIPVYYHQNIVGIHKLDFLIQDQLVLELKTVGEIHKEHYAQVRSYLKAAHKDIGLLINFAAFQLDTRRVELKRKG